MSDCLWPHGLQPTRLLRPWDFPGKSTGVGCHCLLRVRIYWLYKTYISLICLLVLKEMTPPSTNTCGIQILVSTIIYSPVKGTRAFWRNDSRSRPWNIQDKPGACWSDRSEQKVRIRFLSFFFLGYDIFKNHIDADMTKGRKANWKSSQWPKLEQFGKKMNRIKIG